LEENVGQSSTVDSDLGSMGNWPALPEERPAHFPTQDLSKFDAQHSICRAPDLRAIMPRTLVFASGMAIAAYMTVKFHGVIGFDEFWGLKLILVGLFAINALWLALWCVIGVAGFLMILCRRRVSTITVDDLQLRKVAGRTAVLMPIFAEATEQVFGVACATLRALAQERGGENFDLFILSDTTDPLISAREEAMLRTARMLLENGQHLYYRRRATNSDKKAGNIAEWCRRWGAAYEYMVVLDADSLMSGKALVRLAAALEHNPDVALIQTASILINRHSLFGRFQQFTNRVYDWGCPAMRAGTAFWHRGSSCYWGHNAIIRVCAFCRDAGLPHLSGRPPFGGPVLSHDFVEAALLLRAGWRLCLMPEIEESYEETPPTVIDWTIRERRWCQGNLQHCRLITARGLSWTGRLHLAFGIMYLVSAIAWLLFMAAAILLIVLAQHTLPAYSSHDSALFPPWLVRNQEQAIRLFLLTLTLIALPKLLGYSLVVFTREQRRAFGGFAALSISMLLATLVSIVFANIRVLLRCWASFEVLCGRDSGWKPPRRGDYSVPANDVLRFHATHMLLGGVLALAAFTISPPLIVWLLPASLSLVLSGAFSAVGAHPKLGRRARYSGLFLIPDELSPPAIVLDAEKCCNLLSREAL
jgi:membrane glycosyltransferase